MAQPVVGNEMYLVGSLAPTGGWSDPVDTVDEYVCRVCGRTSVHGPNRVHRSTKGQEACRARFELGNWRR